MSETQAMRAGQPTKKRPYVVSRIMVLARQGKTEKQIAEIIGISPSTLTHWKQKDWEFFTSLKENKALADEIVEGSLFKKATGFEHTVTTQVATKDGVETIEQTQYYPPSDTSMIFWLKNRKPEDWKDRREEDIKITLKKEEALRELTTEELLIETQKLLESIKADANQDQTRKE